MVKFMKINSLGGTLNFATSAAFVVIQQPSLLSRHLANEDLLHAVSSQYAVVVRQSVGTMVSGVKKMTK